MVGPSQSVAAEALERVAANVRHWREVRGMSQAALAAELEVEPLTVRSIEAARQKPRFATLVRLAVALDVDIAELFRRRGLVRRRAGRPAKQ